MAAEPREGEAKRTVYCKGSTPRVNLPHGPLHRTQNEAMIKKKLLYS